MRKELDDKLCADYPEIFKDRHAPENQTAMCWGFSCGDGWYDIIDSLCFAIQNDVKWNKAKQPAAFQVKEKFGCLRFYLDSFSTDEMNGYIRMAELLSGKICEICGSPGTNTEEKGWWRTRCEAHKGK